MSLARCYKTPVHLWSPAYAFSFIPEQTLKDAGAIGKAMRDGVKLLGRGSDDFKYPIKIEVSLPHG